jgi:hypothetical protein
MRSATTKKKAGNIMNDLICGMTWEEIQQRQQGTFIAEAIRPTSGDYGCDPIGDGTFKMVPSGDLVTLEERNKRLA